MRKGLESFACKRPLACRACLTLIDALPFMNDPVSLNSACINGASLARRPDGFRKLLSNSGFASDKLICEDSHVSPEILPIAPRPVGLRPKTSFFERISNVPVAEG